MRAGGDDWPPPRSSPADWPAMTGAPLRVPVADAEIADLMWRHAGVFRDRDGLEHAARVLDDAWAVLTAGLRQGRRLDADVWRAASLIVVGRLIARAALRREESRGAHWRADFPEKDDVRWDRHAGDEFAIP
jgi:L-aspartate oxidase